MILQRLARSYLRSGAPWMLERWASTFFESIGAVLDTEAQRVMDGRLANNPYAGTGAGTARLATGQRIECQPDALPWHANDRALPLYGTEPLASKRFRLSRWRQLHARRGTPWGEMEHVAPYFLPGVAPTIHIVHQAGDGSSATWRKLAPDGTRSEHRSTPSNFNYDGMPAGWSRWWAFLDMAGTGIAPPPLYGAGHLYGDGSLYGGGLSAAQCADIVSMFKDWKAAHSWLNAVVLVWPPATIDPTGTPTQDADGRWSLPNGANTWSVLADPGTGKATRPVGYQWIYDAPAT